MTVFVIISLFVCIGLELLSRARQNVDAIQEKFWQNAQSDAGSDYSEPLEEFGNPYDGGHPTAVNMRRRDYTLHTYCEQMYGSLEETPAGQLGKLK